MLSAIEDFHSKNDISPQTGLPRSKDEHLIQIGQMLLSLSKELDLSKPSHLRAHLSLEEFGEWLLALGHGDLVQALDALADRTYVLLGDAVTYGLPLEDAFWEVHRSNMTKERQPDDPEGHRVRNKGPNYKPPDFERILHDRGLL